MSILIGKREIVIKVSVIIIASALAILFPLLFISSEQVVIFDDLLYIPVILSCLWYRRSGLVGALTVVLLHLALKLLMTGVLLADDWLRTLILAAVAVITQALADNNKKHREKLNQLNEELSTEIKRFKKAEKLAGLGIWEMNSVTGATIWSDGMFELFGCQPNSFSPSLDKRLEFSHPDDKSAVKGLIDSAINGNGDHLCDNRIIRADGGVRWVRSLAYMEVHDNGGTVTFIGTLLDITQLKETELRLQQEKEKFRVTIASVGDGIIATDTDAKVTLMNVEAEKLTGWAEAEAIGQPFGSVFSIISEVSRMPAEDPVKTVLRDGITVGLANHTALIAKDGTEHSIADCASPISDAEGNTLGAVIVFRDVTEEKRRQEKINYISYHDSLTGLYNRRYLEEELPYYDMPKNLPVSVIMGDVNGLKLTNDAFGHQAGDRLLIKAADVISAALRTDDIAVRWGGDEFVMILPQTGSETAELMISAIKERCAETKMDSIDLSVAFGCCTKNLPDEDIEAILKNAEDHMYENKIIDCESMRGNLVTTIINTLHEKNPAEEQHSKRVSEISRDIGRAMGLSELEFNKLKVIGLLHDIGKIAVDEAILNKPGKLDAREWDEIKRHPDIGFRILCSSRDMSELAEYVLSHHERFDGNGYPRGLRGDDIPVFSRIVAVADAYDAMTSARKYRDALSPETVIREIEVNRGKQFDPAIAAVFLSEVLPEYSRRTAEQSPPEETNDG